MASRESGIAGGRGIEGGIDGGIEGGGASEGGGGIDGGTNGSNGIEGGELAEGGSEFKAAGPAALLQSRPALGVPPLGTGAPAAFTPSKCLESPAVAATCAVEMIALCGPAIGTIPS